MQLEIAGVQYFSTTSVLDQAGVSRQTLWRWRRQGRIPSGHRFRNGQVLFTRAEFDEVLAHVNRIEPGLMNGPISGAPVPRGGRMSRRRPTVRTPEIYLDNNATTRPLPEVVTAVANTMAEGFGNASSVHTRGEQARRQLRVAREAVASLVGARVDQVIFTGGATEANNLACLGLLTGIDSLSRVVTTAVEHSSVLEAADRLRSDGREVILLPVDTDGRVNPAAMIEAIVPGQTLVSVQWANNETGVVQPVPDLAELAREAGAVFHTDAVQAVGKFDIDLGATAIDLLSMSGHKLHGPLGVGALVGPGVHRVQPLVHGGSQESSIRPGTENIPAIVGLAVALRIRGTRIAEVEAQTLALRDEFEERLRRLGLVDAINGGGAKRLPNTSNVRFRQVDGEALTVRLDQLGLRCSQSSACTNQKPEPSYVLRAMGLPEHEAYASVRFAFSELNTATEMQEAVDLIAEIHAKLTRYAVA